MTRAHDCSALRLRPVEFTAEFYTVLEHANLCIGRFQQQNGAASSFHKVVDTLQMMLSKRGLTVEDPTRAKKMKVFDTLQMMLSKRRAKKMARALT
jgi:serine/threonine-protein kinase HSL1, negative regulator of Swe1 kinase